MMISKMISKEDTQKKLTSQMISSSTNGAGGTAHQISEYFGKLLSLFKG